MPIITLLIERSSTKTVSISWYGDREGKKLIDADMDYDNTVLENTKATTVFIEPKTKIQNYKIDVKNLLKFNSVVIKNSVLTPKDLQQLINNDKRLEITCDEKLEGVDYKNVSCTMLYNPLDCPSSVFRNVIIDNDAIIYEFLSSLRGVKTDIENLTLCPTFNDNLHINLFLDLMQNVNIPNVTLTANVNYGIFNLPAFIGLNKFTSINLYEYTKITYVKPLGDVHNNTLKSFSTSSVYIPEYIKTILENNK